MGIQDREYLREEPPSGLQLSMPQSMTVILVIINALVFLVDMFFFSAPGPNQHALMWWMACSTDSLTHPWLLWQLLTSGFAHSPYSIWHILFNMFVLWSFGTTVESRLGRWEFLRFYLLAIVFGSLVFCLRQWAMFGGELAIPCLGASGAVTAVIILYALYNPNATIYLMMVLPVKAWVAAVLIVMVNLFGERGLPVGGPANVAYDVHLAGAALALAYFKFGWNFGRIFPAMPSALQGDWRTWFKRKPKLTLHNPENDPGGYDYQDAEADRILVKIDREGMNSLTAKERKILEEYSRRMQQKHR